MWLFSATDALAFVSVFTGSISTASLNWPLLRLPTLLVLRRVDSFDLVGLRDGVIAVEADMVKADMVDIDA